MPFSDLSLSSDLLRALAALGISEPFPVQKAVIPRVLAGKDLCVSAKTGSGKTIAFAAPIIDRLGSVEPRRSGSAIVDAASSRGSASSRGGVSRKSGEVRALVLVPTRELATQVGLVFETLCRGARFPLTVRVVHGGSSINPQMLALRGGADILVATPGRLIDLSSRNAARLGSVEFLVLDEADKMLDLGFRDELAAIMSLVPENRQSLLFSATFPAELEAVAAAALRESERVALDLPAESGANGGNEKLGEIKASRASDSVAAAPGAAIEELVYLVARDDKGPFLRRLISTDPRFERVLVFASSTRRADNVARKLVNNGIAAAAFHGGLSQAARTKALSDFRGGAVRALVASDLASRGLDIEGLPCVVNYELPRAPIDYVHRIGRTGRAGARGLAVSLISPDEEAHLRLIEKRVGRKIARREA